MEWILIAGITILCFACPILILLYLEWMPWYVSVAFAIWVISCITTIAFFKCKEKKWYERMIPSFILTFVFTALFLTSMDTDHYMFDENIALWVVAPTLSLPVFYFVGKWIDDKLQSKQEQKKQEYNNSIDKQIGDKITEIRNLEQLIKNKTAVIHLVSMMKYCGEDVSQILNESRINDIVQISYDIKHIQNEISVLKKSKK